MSKATTGETTIEIQTMSEQFLFPYVYLVMLMNFRHYVYIEQSRLQQ